MECVAWWFSRESIEAGLVRDLILFRGSYKDNPFLGIPFISFLTVGSQRPSPQPPSLEFQLRCRMYFSIVVNTPTRQIPLSSQKAETGDPGMVSLGSTL